LSNSSWFVVFTIVLNSVFLVSCFLNWHKPRSAFTWMLSLFTSVYYAPLWLLSLFLLILLSLTHQNVSAWIPSFSGFLSLSLVFIYKIKNTPLKLSELNWRRLFFPRLLPSQPTAQLSCPVSEGVQTVDYFAPPDIQSRHAVFFLFGGGFLNNDQSQLRLFNQRLAAHGFHVFALNYRQLPRHPWPIPLKDILEMVRWTLDYLPDSIVIDKFFMGGRSAGGCLAMMSSAEIVDPRHAGCFAIYPVTDLLAWANEKYSNLTLRSRWRVNLLCNNDETLAKNISPVHLKYSSNKKFLILSGDFDPLVDVNESHELHQVLINQGCSSSLHILKNESHGCDASLDSLAGQKVEKLLIQFLQS
jgi:acetyl esterase/lipase